MDNVHIIYLQILKLKRKELTNDYTISLLNYKTRSTFLTKKKIKWINYYKNKGDEKIEYFISIEDIIIEKLKNFRILLFIQEIDVILIYKKQKRWVIAWYFWR